MYMVQLKYDICIPWKNGLHRRIFNICVHLISFHLYLYFTGSKHNIDTFEIVWFVSKIICKLFKSIFVMFSCLNTFKKIHSNVRLVFCERKLSYIIYIFQQELVIVINSTLTKHRNSSVIAGLVQDLFKVLVT